MPNPSPPRLQGKTALDLARVFKHPGATAVLEHAHAVDAAGGSGARELDEWGKVFTPLEQGEGGAAGALKKRLVAATKVGLDTFDLGPLQEALAEAVEVGPSLAVLSQEAQDAVTKEVDAAKRAQFRYQSWYMFCMMMYFSYT